MKTVSTYLLFAMATIASMAQDGKQLISEMIATVGGKDTYYKLENVKYDYAYRNPKAPMTLVSHETYVFNGEKSYANYSQHTVTAPEGATVIEGYNGKDAWVSKNGALSHEEQANGFARFIRKTNYYWFSMFFKLLDDGVRYEYMGEKTTDGKNYHLVKIGFGENVGDAQDTYVLYINKKTKLVDQFLFTIMGFGMAEPHLMVIEYETVEGIKIGSKRKYIEADWEGNIKGDQWTTTDWTNIQFNTAIDQAIFEKPNN